MKNIVIIGICLMLCSCSLSQSVTTSTYSSQDNKSYGWGIKKEQNKEPEMPQYIKDMLAENDSFYMGDKDAKKLYLTFDEGYENGYTAEILDTLKEKGVTAAFFITGDYLTRSGDLVRRMVDEGHIVGNHTEGHKNLPRLSDEDVAKEISLLSERFYNEYGAEMKYMRPPEGEYSRRILSIAHDMGYKTAFWSFAYKDWLKDDIKGADYAVGQIMPYLHNGCVILLHAVSSDNAKALPIVIDRAREQGYEFSSLDEI